jgi:hypothetical protein
MAQKITLNNGDIFKIGNVAYVALVMPYNSLLFRPIDMNSGSDINMIKIVDANYFDESTPEPTYEYPLTPKDSYKK